MASADDGTGVPVSPLPASSSNMGSPNASLPDLEEVGGRPTSTMEEKFEAMLAKRFAQFEVHFAALASIPVLVQGCTGFENSILSLHTISGLCHSHHFKWWCLAARVAAVEAGAASASSGSGSASSWNLLGSGDGSTATGSLGSHGQGSSDDSRNTRRRLDTFSSPEEEHARAVLLRFPCKQYREGVSAWINRFWAATNAPALVKPTRIHSKTDSMSARLVFETRAKCQDFVARYKDDGMPYEVDSPFCNAKTNIAVRQSESHEDREIEKQFAPLWRVLAPTAPNSLP